MQLGDSQAMTHCSKYGQLSKHITNLQDVNTLEEELTDDEAICPFKGCIIFHIYIKESPTNME
jgi:hypothetical protein